MSVRGWSKLLVKRPLQGLIKCKKPRICAYSSNQHGLDEAKAPSLLDVQAYRLLSVEAHLACRKGVK